MSVREESFILIDETVPSLRENKTHLELDSVGGTFLNSELDIVASKEIEAAYPNNIFGTKLTEIGAHSIFSEPESGIADLSFSINVSADCSLIGKEFTSEVGFLTANDTVNLHNDLGLIAGIENINCGLGISGDLLIDKPNGEILSLDSQGVTVSGSTYETGSLVSFNEGVLIDTSLGYADGRNEFSVADAYLGDMFYGPKLTGEASFLGTSEKTFLDAGIDSVFDFEVARDEEDLLEKAVHEALEKFGKSFKLGDSEFSVESFMKRYQSNISSGFNINIAVINFFNVEGDAKDNIVNVFINENNNHQ